AAPRRRAHGDEHGIGIRQRARKVERELEPPGRDVALDQLVQSRLEDRNAPLAQRLDLAGVLVDAAHVMPEIRKARSRDQADVARADHHYAHISLPNLASGTQSVSTRNSRFRRAPVQKRDARLPPKPALTDVSRLACTGLKPAGRSRQSALVALTGGSRLQRTRARHAAGIGTKHAR